MKEQLPGLGVTSGPCFNCNLVKSELKNGYCKDCRTRFGFGTRKQAMEEWEQKRTEETDEEIEPSDLEKSVHVQEVDDMLSHIGNSEEE